MNKPLQPYNHQGSTLPVSHSLGTANQSQTLPLKSIPKVIENLVKSVSQDMQVPIELVFNMAMTAISFACQSHIEIIPPYSDIPEPCSLYFLTIAESGEGKTTINKLLMKPFYDYEAKMKQAYKLRLEEHKRDLEVWESKKKALHSAFRQAVKYSDDGEAEAEKIKSHALNKPVKPTRPDFIYEDTSPTALFEGVNEQPDAMLYSDEGGIFSKGSLKDHPEALNRMWDGGKYDFRRANRDVLEISACLTASLMIQPIVFMGYLKKNPETARGSGLLSRFLIVQVNSMIGYRQENTNYSKSTEALKKFHDIINDLLDKRRNRFDNGDFKKETYCLSDEAKDSLQRKRAEIEKSLALGYERAHIRDLTSKACANALRLAAIFSHISCHGSGFIFNNIFESELKKAFEITDWYLEQARVLFFPMSERCQFEKDVRELFCWIRDKFEETGGYPFLKNELVRKGPNRFRKIEVLTPVLNQLIVQGLICVIDGYYGTRALHIAYRERNGCIRLPYIQALPNQFVREIIVSSNISRQPDVDLSDL